MRALLLSFLLFASEDAYEAQSLAEAAPDGVAEAVRKELSPAGARVLSPDKKPFADFWLRKALPVGAPRDLLGLRFPELRDGSMLGVARFHVAAQDFRGSKVAPGLYTLRYHTQPEDGDHQGTIDSRDFLMIAPAEADGSPETLKPEEAVKLSGKVTGKRHPAVLYLVKPIGEGETFPRMARDANVNRWHLEVEAAKVRMSIVVVGKAPDF